MFRKIRTAVKRIFCKHDFKPVRWHWTHGSNGNEPAFVEAEWCCEKCGKLDYRYPERGSFEEKLYVDYRKDLQD